jgi:hypothetical protein
MRTRFTVTVEVETRSEAEAWRLFNAKLQDGHGDVQVEVFHRDPCDFPDAKGRQGTILPSMMVPTIPACRDGDTLPCSGVQPIRSQR